MIPQQIVEQIFNEKAKNDSNAGDLARALNVLSKTVFGDLNRFIFELLQNADDSSQPNQQIDVHFTLLDNYLIFSHNGTHFTEEDVVGISGIGNKASEKDKKAEKIGYKGIGFKSVFGSADYVHIISAGYSFRFDKNYKYYEEMGGSDGFPWQVIPIWTEQPESEIMGFYDPNRVNTIIGIYDRVTVSQEILKTFRDNQILLFLRRVTSISFFEGSTCVFKFEKSVTNNLISIYNNGTHVSSWIIKDFLLPVSETLSKRLNLLTDTECPPKLKEAANTKLTFAARIDDGHFIPVKSAVIYSYLPTKSALGFAYLINGDFLTNAERTELMPNVWNEFLLNQIAIKQVEWFAELQQGDFRFEVLKLLRGKFPTYQISPVLAAYNSGLEGACRSIPFLPVQGNDKHLVTITQSIIDSPKFSSLFAASIISSYLRKQGVEVLDLRLENQNSIPSLGATNFSIDDLLKLIPSGYIGTPTDGTNVVVFFYNSTLDNKNQTWLTKLRETAFLMDETSCYRTPKEIFIPAENLKAGSSEFANLNFVHSSILDHFKNSPDVIEWLFDLGVRQPSDLEIFRKAIVPLIKETKITKENVVAISRFIFKVFKQKLLSDGDYVNLKEMPVLSSKGLQKAGHCYFSDIYSPEKKLSLIIPDANFLVGDYIETNEDITNWKIFFRNIGVRENLTIDIIEEKVERSMLEQQYPESKLYCFWLEKNYIDSIYHTWRYSGQHYVQGFTFVGFRQHFADPTFSKSFWSKTLDNWQDFGPKYSSTTYYYLRGHISVPSFIQYYAQNFESIKCTDGKCRRSTDVFSPSLKALIGDLFPVADLTSAITKEQSDFFGFKRDISVSECLELLKSISALNISIELTKQIYFIYDYLISQSGDKTEKSRNAISEFNLSGTLLTTNNTFQPTSSLFCFAVAGINTPINSGRFIKLRNTLSFAEIEALCTYLNIPIITFEDLQFVANKAISDLDLKNILINKAKYIALIYSQKFSGDYQQIYSRLKSGLETMEFMVADALSLVYKTDDGDLVFNSKVTSWLEGENCFYYISKWRSPLAIYELSGSLCAHFGLKDLEIELSLILQLSHAEITDWLAEKGYELNSIVAVDDNLQETPMISEPTLILEELPDFEIETREVFEEKVKVSDINFSNITLTAKDYSSNFAASNKNHATIASSQVKVDIGRWAEEFVFKYLKTNSQIFSEIKWMNEVIESYLPYDFEVKENNTPLFIEVKGTPSLTKDVIYLSADEWRILFEKGSNYTIFRVLGVGTESYVLERTNNLRELIEDAKLLSFPIEISLP